MAARGKRRGGRRRAETPQTRLSARALGLAAGITACLVAWGYLVYAAIDFGTTARAGQDAAWGLLALASVGAVACLFVGLMLMSRLGGALGLGGAVPAGRRVPPASPASADDPVTVSAAAGSTPSAYPGRATSQTEPPQVPRQRTDHRHAGRQAGRPAPRNGQRVKGGKRAAR